jgi:ribosomal protein L11 methyltransferase
LTPPAEDAAWYRVSLRASPETLEAAGLLLVDAGAGGLLEEEDGLAAYFASDRREAVDLLLGTYARDVGGALRWNWEAVAPGWQDSWKAFFRPVRVSPRLAVCPSWESWTPQDPEVRVISMDPGRAFGTGTHETTRLCLSLLDRVLTRDPPGPLLDVGSGSGILSVAAALLGVPRVVAADIDLLAAEATRENADRNGVGSRVVVLCGDLRSVRGTYPIAVANILYQVLLGLAPVLSAKVAPGGTLLLSGMLAPELDSAGRVYGEQRFRETGREVLGEWGAILLRRPP